MLHATLRRTARNATATTRLNAIARTVMSMTSPRIVAQSLPHRCFSAKSPRTRVEQHPQQQKRHKRAAAAAAEVINQHEEDGSTIADAFTVAESAQPSTAASSPTQTPADPESTQSDPINVPSRLISSEPAPRRRAPEVPTDFDAQGRAILRTKLHPSGAIVGRGRVVANFGTRMLVQELPWEAHGEAEPKAGEPAAAAATVLPSPAVAQPPTRSPSANHALEEGLRFIAVPRGKLGKIVCGDLVLWEWSSNHQDSSAFIVEVLPRQTEFRRAERGSSGSQLSAKIAREEVLLASNFNHMAIVCAAEPATNATLLDRYLSAAQRMGVSSCIIFNKTDLPAAARFEQDMKDFEALGVKVFRTSCAEGKTSGIEALREHLATVGPEPGRGITIFVGQSGSGKSSLLNTLSPSLQLAVNSLSRNAQGRHTTTQTILHTLESGGEIIDSPGFQNFQPAPVPLREVVQGFTEIARAAKFCHLGARCLHITEPGCAVKMCLKASAAAGNGAVTGAKMSMATTLPEPSVPPVEGTAAPSAEGPLLTADSAPYISPEAAFFSAFQAAKAKELGLDSEWNAQIKDMYVPGMEGDPSDLVPKPGEGDPNADPLAHTRTKAWGARQQRREEQHAEKVEAARDMQRVAKENARMRALAEAAAKGEVLDASADESGTSLSQPRSHAAERQLHITHQLAESGLLDSISQRRYRSYVDLVRQQVQLEKHKYD